MTMVDRRRARYGARGGNLTPLEAKKKLTLPIYAMLSGQAQASYPGSNLASPSSMVSIVPTASSCVNTPDGRAVGLPCWVNCKQWLTAVVPVLQDPRFTPQNAVITALLQNQWQVYLEALGNAIAQSFSDAGYGPVDK